MPPLAWETLNGTSTVSPSRIGGEFIWCFYCRKMLSKTYNLSIHSYNNCTKRRKVHSLFILCFCCVVESWGWWYLIYLTCTILTWYQSQFDICSHERGLWIAIYKLCHWALFSLFLQRFWYWLGYRWCYCVSEQGSYRGSVCESWRALLEQWVLLLELWCG